MALLDNHRKAIRHIAAIGDAVDVPVRAGKQLFQTGKYLLNEGIGVATGVKMPGVKAAAEPIFGGVADRIGGIGEMVKSDLVARGAVPTVAQRIDAPKSQATARKEPTQPLGPADLSRMSNGQLPNDFVKKKGGVVNALNAVTGPTPAAAPSVTPETAATSAATAQPPKVQPIDGGSGYAVVNGKRINYQDIGTSGDPLKKSGGYVMTKGNGVPAINAPADPAIGAMDREVKRIQGVQDDLNLSGIGVMSPAAARQSIAFRQGQQDLDQRGDMVSIAAEKEANEADYQNKALAINAPLIEAKTKKELSDAAVNQFAISPEGIKQTQAKEGAKDRKEAVNRYFNLFKDRALPQEWAGKHMELAKKFAMADDPDNDYAIYFNPANPGRMGIGVSRKVFEPLISRHLQAGYPKADATARAFGDLQRASQAKGIKLYEDIPNMDRFPKTANKPVDELGVS